MKAYQVRPQTEYDYDQYTVFVHAETESKAKIAARNCDPGDDFRDTDYINLRTRRIPELDNLPFTLENLHDAGWSFSIEGGDGEEFINDCRCAICRSI